MHDSVAMDGYAVRGAELEPDAKTAQGQIGGALAGRLFANMDERARDDRGGDACGHRL